VQRSVHREVGNIQHLIGNKHADGHRPRSDLRHSARKLTEQVKRDSASINPPKILFYIMRLLYHEVWNLLEICKISIFIQDTKRNAERQALCVSSAQPLSRCIPRTVMFRA
jgi:hypothetical protein